MTDGLYAGVELGGTKCVLTLAQGDRTIVAQQVVPTTAPDETLGMVESVMLGWQAHHPVRALGVASFGPVDLQRSSRTFGYITKTSKLRWSGTDVAQRLQNALGVPMSFDTDVNGAALAEMRWGAGQGMQDFAYVTVGTGVGVGLIANGKSMRGFLHSELGHIRVPRLTGDDWPGACPFHGDCLEGIASGGALKKRFEGQSLDDIAQDHPVWESVAWSLAQLCHTITCTAAPHAIAFGGGVIERQPHLLGRIEPLLRESLADYFHLPEQYVRRPALGAMAGPLGSIALAMDAPR